MGVHLDVFGPLPVIDLPSKVFHDGNRATVWSNLHDWEEEIALFLTLERWSQTDHNAEVLLLGCALARLEGIAGDIGATGVGSIATV